MQDMRIIDPLASAFTGLDFLDDNYSDVHDRVFISRLYNEFFETTYSDKENDEKIRAILYCCDKNMTRFSSEAKEYLTTLDRPLEALFHMPPPSFDMRSIEYSTLSDMVNIDPGLLYDDSKLLDFIDIVENKVAHLIDPPENRRIDYKNVQDQIMVIDGYKEMDKTNINGRLLIIAENPEATEGKHRYMVGEYSINNLFATLRTQHICTTNDYFYALSEYTNIVQSNIQYATAQRDTRNKEYGIDEPMTLTADHCIKDGLKDNLKDKVIIIKADVFIAECSTADYQLQICKGGFGANPNARGSAVICENLFTGKSSRFERDEVLGVADVDKLPEWAVKRIALLEAIKEPDVFEFGGYHFKPYKSFKKGETSRQLKGDSRPRKTDAQYAMRNMSTDLDLGLSTYEWKKAGTYYSNEKFYAASGNSEADIFLCLENGKLYVPDENELFHYKEPLLKQQGVQKDQVIDGKSAANSNLSSKNGAEKLTLQEKMENAREKIAQNDAANISAHGTGVSNDKSHRNNDEEVL